MSWVVSIAAAFLHTEDLREARDDSVFDFVNVQLAPEQILHRGDRLAFAGNNQIEETKIRVYVQGKAVGGNPASDMHSNGRNLSLWRVNASQSFDPKCLNTEISHCADQNLFQIANIAVDVFTLRAQIDYGVANDLAQSVIGNLAAPISFKDGNAPGLESFLRQQNSGIVATPSNRQRVRVFEQQQSVRLLAGLHRAFSFSLQRQGRHIFN